jgi:competence protein ComEA
MIRILISIFFASMAQAQTLPDGPGKEVVQKVCTPCHGLQNVIKARMTKERWAAVVDDMVAKGAEGTDDEMDKVTNYLAATFSIRKVNVNSAAAEDLVSALGISLADASAIVKYRTGKGKFKDLQELTKVPGINVSKIVVAKDFIEF